MKALLFFLFLSICLFDKLFSQNAGIGTATPNASAKLEIASNSSGFLLPRMTTAERNAIVTPAVGLMIFDIEKSAFYFYNGSSWLPLLTSSPNNIPPIEKSVSDGAAGDSLGWSVSISGNYAIAGAPGDDIGANADQGSAYIFFKQNGIWTEQAKLTAADGAAGDVFGFSVSISGDYAIVGAYLDDETFANQGSAYIFTRIGAVWTQQAKLIATDPVTDDAFGRSVSISADYVLIGVPGDDVNVPNQGSAYVYVRSGTVWSQQVNLTNPGALSGDSFGSTVSISGAYAAMGAPGRSGGFTAPAIGAAYVFFRTGASWAVQLQRLGGVALERLGSSISVSGSNLIIGHVRSGTSCADIFTRSGTVWNFNSTLTPPSGLAGDFFSNAVSISSDYSLGGAPEADMQAYINTGASLLYKRNGNAWNYLRRIEDIAAQTGGAFGYACAIDGFNMIIGAVGKNAKRGEVFFLNIE